MNDKQFLELSMKIGNALKSIPKVWDGRQAILEMKENGYKHWKQMEWIGFYFEYLCERNLRGIMEIPGKWYGKVGFDGFLQIPWDFKAHATNTSSHRIIVNDSEAISNAIQDYGSVGLIIAIGDVQYNDENRTFQQWHQKLKGGLSNYEIERIKRGAWSRLRKVRFDLRQLSFIKITDATLVKGGSFQEGFRNADGSPRRKKLLIDLEKIDEELLYHIDF